ncbi:MAG TPA: tripartite tricarboxylate transporter permease [Falsiroseomonas sp.]|jgi:putative tricarboxylic transport membrane protein|nr:tripartite tricarboxylate transporter permease [Falsiroseomonas sp.]
MEAMEALFGGFAVILTWQNIQFVFIGSLVGTLIGVLPGIGPLAALALLLPATLSLPPVAAVAMLCAIFYGAMYGGSITSILVNIPGEAASVVTCLDGHAMAKQGRAGPALAAAALSSFVAGTVGIVILTFAAPMLSEFAIRLGPPEYCALMALGLVCTILMIQGSALKGMVMIGLGAALAAIGMDIVTGEFRFTFGTIELAGGIDLLAVVIGLFGVSEILANVEQAARGMRVKAPFFGVWPRAADWRAAWAPTLRGSGLGFAVGLVPGGGPVTASFLSYAMERRVGKNPETFGKGRIEGVAGPEAANNAAVSSGMIPLLSLGIPGNAVTALLMGALIINGVQPGPMMIVDRADVFWGVVASLYIGNVFLLLLNLPLVGLWVQLLRVPYAVLFPSILLLALVGTYSSNRSFFDLWVMLGFGVAGWFLRKLGYELAPLVLAFVLAPLLEQSLRQSMVMSPDGALIFLERPIAVVLLALAAVALALVAFKGRTSKLVGETT